MTPSPAVAPPAAPTPNALPMPTITLGFAAALVGIGLLGYLAGRSATALIPAAVGVLLGACGLIARNPAARKHAMHAAAMIGLIGLLASAGRLIGSLAQGLTPTGLALFSLGTMSLLCAAFVAVCVRSFIDARRARQAGVA